ncbi:MAG: branched-chain amino acid ABC transporter substrate-binding protein [Alphaproteobacteria bacterium]|nr:branched-chain amino acid ABC transporter substrate-binding protein [Alphaproteobacteria bacterium]
MKKFLLALGLVCVASAAHADISIGLIAPLTGQYAVFGEQIKKGAEQAVKNINAAGGVLGQQLKLETADDACDPKQAVAAANQMASKGVKYVVGHYCSGSAIPSSKVLMEEKVLLISPGATNPKYTDEGSDTVFRVCGRDDKQGGVIANEIVTKYKGKNVALLNDKSAYGRGLADEVKRELNKAGITEAKFESFAAGEKDYSAIVASLKQANIDVVFIGGYHTESGLITRQLREAGSKAQVIGGDALVTNEFWSITGNAGEGVLMTFGPDPRKNADAKTVVAEFHKQNYEPEGYTLYSYASVQIFADAIKNAGANDVTKVTKAMHGDKFKTVLGELGFDAKGDVLAPAYVLYIWKDGKYAER